MNTITYTWKITHLEMIKELGTVSNIVSTVHWVLEARRDSDDRYARDFGVQILDTENINETTFTNYENLTEEQVVGWLQSTLNKHTPEREYEGYENMVEFLKANLAITLEEQNVYRNTGLPW